jgi:glucokinase
MTHAIGIDFGGTTIKSGLVCGGEIVRRGEVIDTQQCSGPDALLDALVAVVRGLRGDEAAAVGIGLPGLVDSVNGYVHELTNVPGWCDVPLRMKLRERSGLPVAIENDANAMAWGEWRYGAARNGRHVVCVTLGTGVGGALILDGRLYRGAQLGAGEIGHMSIDLHGRPGPYGNDGGLEEYVGNQQIAERAQALYRDGKIEKTLDECTPFRLSEAARAGDAIARRVWEEVGLEIGAALASVVWILNPDTIVIGGGVAKAGDLVFAPVRRAIEARTSRVFHEHLRLVPAELGNDAGIIGSAALALEAVETERAVRM